MNDAEALAFAERVLKLAWADLPPAHRSLLESIGAEGPDRLDRPSRENALARVAWHEWGHALSLHGATREDVAAGQELLESLPSALADTIRLAGYLGREYTHEVVAEVYALLMLRRRKGVIGRPTWVSDQVDELIRRVVGWIQ